MYDSLLIIIMWTTVVTSIVAASAALYLQHREERRRRMMNVEYTEEDLMSYEETLDFILDQIGKDLGERESEAIEMLRLQLRELDKLELDEETRRQHEQWKRHANSPYT